MSVYYPDATCGGEEAVPVYNCNPCPDYEYGRVRSVAYIKTDYIATVLANPTSSAVWSTGINAGDIVVIWQTSGSYDGGTQEEIPGFGDVQTANGGVDHVLTYRDPNYKENSDFYNAIRTNSEYTVAYRTSDSIHFSESAVTISPKNPVQDDLKSVVVWEVTVKWSNADSPVAYDIPSGIFDSCSILIA
jgi:hypothetical protein